MSKLLDKFRKSYKYGDKGRLVGNEVADITHEIPVPYRTKYGGMRTMGYNIDESLREQEDQIMLIITDVIDKDLTDMYSDPGMFSTLVEAFYEKMHLQVRERSINNEFVEYSIKESIANERKEIDDYIELVNMQANKFERKGDYYEKDYR